MAPENPCTTQRGTSPWTDTRTLYPPPLTVPIHKEYSELRFFHSEVSLSVSVQRWARWKHPDWEPSCPVILGTPQQSNKPPLHLCSSRRLAFCHFMKQTDGWENECPLFPPSLDLLYFLPSPLPSFSPSLSLSFPHSYFWPSPFGSRLTVVIWIRMAPKALIFALFIPS